MVCGLSLAGSRRLKRLSTAPNRCSTFVWKPLQPGATRVCGLWAEGADSTTTTTADCRGSAPWPPAIAAFLEFYGTGPVVPGRFGAAVVASKDLEIDRQYE